MKSTLGVTYFRNTKKVINHIYPDVENRRVGLEVPRTKIKTSEYSSTLMNKAYKDHKQPKVSSKFIKAQCLQRKKREKAIKKLKLN